MAYTVLRALIRVLLAVFYRRVEVVGLDRVPETGPLIVAVNHQNALVDPMLVIAALPRRLQPVAKAPLFRHPLIAPFLYAIGAIPVHRRAESGADASRNDAMYRAAATTLGSGGAIMIFPEGLSQPEPALMPLRTGAARMALAALAEGVPVTLLPVGLVLQEPGTFRVARAFVIIGDAVPITDLAAMSADRAIRAVTDRLAEGLRAVIVEAESRDTLRLLALLETIAAGGVGRDAATRTAWMRQAMAAYRRLRVIASARAAGFRADVERYAKDLELAGIGPTRPGRGYRAGAVWRFALREGAALLGGLPLALLGIVANVLPYQATRLIVRALPHESDVDATYKLVVAVVLFPLAWFGEAWLIARYAHPAVFGLFVAALLPAGFLALTWHDRLRRFARETQAFVRFIVDRDLDARLAARRVAIVEEMRALARLAGSL
jgi:1-acyl-sn-glycerol-3-phosphate acyltransferase